MIQTYNYHKLQPSLIYINNLFKRSAEFENENASKVTIIDGSRTMICIKNNLGILRLMNLNTNILKTLLEFGDRNGSVFILIFTSIDRKLSELDGKSGSDFYFEITSRIHHNHHSDGGSTCSNN
ncbi:3023_t:CDS:2 [Entrophospora sp. SA101]|nr:3023_t:CDS:2 [Entrophospora sp. SA101]